MKKINKKINRKFKSKKTPVNKNTFTWFTVITPLICWAMYVSLALHCRWVGGHWPKPMLENIHIKTYLIHERALWIFSYVVLVSLPCWLVMLFFKKFRINIKTHLLQFIVFGFGILLIILTLMFDPTPFTEWFFD